MVPNVGSIISLHILMGDPAMDQSAMVDASGVGEETGTTDLACAWEACGTVRRRASLYRMVHLLALA